MNQRLQSGLKTLSMWEMDELKRKNLDAVRGWGAIGTNRSRDSANLCRLTIEFPCFNYEVVAPRYPIEVEYASCSDMKIDTFPIPPPPPVTSRKEKILNEKSP